MNVWSIIHEFILGYNNKNLNPREPHLRPAIARFYCFIVFAYSALVVTGTSANLAVLFHILRHKLHSDATYGLILNNVISDIVKCVIVVPISLYVLLVQNWTLGELLCSFLPMLQVQYMIFDGFLGFFTTPCKTEVS